MAAEPAFHLPVSHYASHWNEDPRPIKEMSELARRFAEMPADVPDARLPGEVIPKPVKQDVLLELCRALHSYLMMIRRAHVRPPWLFAGHLQ
jgi:hypothetical protein